MTSSTTPATTAATTTTNGSDDDVDVEASTRSVPPVANAAGSAESETPLNERNAITAPGSNQRLSNLSISDTELEVFCRRRSPARVLGGLALIAALLGAGIAAAVYGTAPKKNAKASAPTATTATSTAAPPPTPTQTTSVAAASTPAPSTTPTQATPAEVKPTSKTASTPPRDDEPKKAKAAHAKSAPQAKAAHAKAPRAATAAKPAQAKTPSVYNPGVTTTKSPKARSGSGSGPYGRLPGT